MEPAFCYNPFVMKYQIIIFGCQFNYTDSERLETVLKKLGYKKAGNGDQADLVFVLACSVRKSAVDRIYGLKRKWTEVRKKYPLVTVLSGCVMEYDKKKMAEFFDIILSITDLKKLPKLLAQKALDLPADYYKIHPSYVSDFQAYVPIMSGCNNFCAYCVVPYTRGREKSRPAKDIVKECRSLIRKGYKEINLLGQNVNSYKDDKINFPKLLRMVDEIEGNYWIRFVSSHPKDFSDELIEVMKDGKHITPYLHLPVQAGDNVILKKMNRNYTIEHYKKLIEKVRKAIPGISVSTDVIVGFPGETKQQFKNTVKLFREVKFDMAYIAKYSERPGTAAARLEDSVSEVEKKKREKELTEVLRKTSSDYNEKFVGQKVKVLVEECKDGFYSGKTAHFKTIKIPTDNNVVGQWAKARIVKADSWGLRGEIDDSSG